MHPRLTPVARNVIGAVALGAVVLVGGTEAGAQSAAGGVKATPLFSQKIPDLPGKTMTVVAVDYQPGAASKPHRHPASGGVFVYVVSGTVRAQLEGGELKVYGAGESWFEPPNAHHIVSANASTTDPARILAVIVADDGTQTTVYDQ